MFHFWRKQLFILKISSKLTFWTWSCTNVVQLYHVSHDNISHITYHMITLNFIYWQENEMVSAQKGYIWDVLKMDQFKLKGMIGASKRFVTYFGLGCADVHESFEVRHGTWNLLPSSLIFSAFLHCFTLQPTR